MRKKIEAILDRIRPALDTHGGDVELVKINQKAKTVSIRFIGTCDHCAISEITLKYLVEKEIRTAYPEITGVIAV
jgi:Fe-S cluster biogenesis protein NfuA